MRQNVLVSRRARARKEPRTTSARSPLVNAARREWLALVIGAVICAVVVGLAKLYGPSLPDLGLDSTFMPPMRWSAL